MKKQTLTVIVVIALILALLLIIFNIEQLFPLPDPNTIAGAANG